MKVSEQTIQQIERAIKKISQKFPIGDNACIMTDIHLRVFQESGELMAFDDDDKEITRCVIEEWIENKDDSFYDDVTVIMRKVFERLRDIVDNLNILKPYSFVLENDDKENVAEIYVADDDTVIIGGDLIKGWDSELDAFFNKLLEE